MLKRKQKSDNAFACTSRESRKLSTNLMWCEMKWFIFCAIAEILGIGLWENEKKSTIFFVLKKIISKRTKEWQKESLGQVATMTQERERASMHETESTYKNARTYSRFYDLNVLDLYFLSNWNSVAEQFLLVSHVTLIYGPHAYMHCRAFHFYGFFRSYFLSFVRSFNCLRFFFIYFLWKTTDFNPISFSDFLGLLHFVNECYDFLTSFVRTQIQRYAIICGLSRWTKFNWRRKNCHNVHKKPRKWWIQICVERAFSM